jgi:hypothetical protein
MARGLYPLITRDPASGAEMIVTRLECPESGTVLEGRFGLGWVGRLTPEQLDFVGLLLKQRNNLQKLANELGVAYNTARTRLDEVVAALGGEAEEEKDRAVEELIGKLASKEITFEEAMTKLRGRKTTR